MPTLHSLRSRVKTLSRSNPSSDPAADVARIYEMLAPLFGILGCGDEPTDNREKKGGDSGENKG